ncbi:MAG: OmpA family protein [Bacteroidota bacterium]
MQHSTPFRSVFSLILCVFFGVSIQAQSPNLVPNSSFETVKKPRCRWVQSKRQFDRSLSDWKTATETHPDLFNTAVEPTCWAHPQKQSDGKQLPHTGNVMAGLSLLGLGGKKDNHVAWYEYVQVQLSAPLEPGKKYYAEVWVLLAEVATKASNNLGMWFSDTLVNTRTRMPLCTTPHINHPDLLMTKGNQWQKVSGVFEATSSMQYLVIGNFYNDLETTIKVVKGGTKGAYYHIDDVLVRPATAGEAVSAPPRESTCPQLKALPTRSTTTENDLTEVQFETGKTIQLNNIFFDIDKAVLLPASIAELDKLVHSMYNYPYMEIEINGHTDNTGSDAHNQSLSAARAKAVVDYLIKHKISASRMTHQGFGSSKPIGSNDTDAGRQQNRRVEMVVKKM